MIELIVADRCTDCGACIEVCPANVRDPGRAGLPVLARAGHL
jgi:NAD-dependent dihydropyrimidine dehydrogenase PreA subunit